MRTRIVLKTGGDDPGQNPVLRGSPQELQAQIDECLARFDNPTFIILWDEAGNSWSGSPAAIARLEPIE